MSLTSVSRHRDRGRGCRPGTYADSRRTSPGRAPGGPDAVPESAVRLLHCPDFARYRLLGCEHWRVRTCRAVPAGVCAWKRRDHGGRHCWWFQADAGGGPPLPAGDDRHGPLQSISVVGGTSAGTRWAMSIPTSEKRGDHPVVHRDACRVTAKPARLSWRRYGH